MAGIKGKDTKPELVIRRALHALGYRYRLHYKKLPGKPDLVFPKYKVAIFIHGCFWHKHSCHLFKWPSTRPQFWKEKIGSNKKRDLENREKILKKGWRVLIIWECALKGKVKVQLKEVVYETEKFLLGPNRFMEIAGEDRS